MGTKSGTLRCRECVVRKLRRRSGHKRLRSTLQFTIGTDLTEAAERQLECQERRSLEIVFHRQLLERARLALPRCRTVVGWATPIFAGRMPEAIRLAAPFVVSMRRLGGMLFVRGHCFVEYFIAHDSDAHRGLLLRIVRPGRHEPGVTLTLPDAFHRRPEHPVRGPSRSFGETRLFLLARGCRSCCDRLLPWHTSGWVTGY